MSKGNYGLSIPDLDEIIERYDLLKDGKVCGTGCGSTEYVFNTKDTRNREAKKIAKKLRDLAKQFERGDYNCDFHDEPEEDLTPAGYFEK